MISVHSLRFYSNISVGKSVKNLNVENRIEILCRLVSHYTHYSDNPRDRRMECKLARILTIYLPKFVREDVTWRRIHMTISPSCQLVSYFRKAVPVKL
jgi:hypothetical protein